METKQQIEEALFIEKFQQVNRGLESDDLAEGSNGGFKTEGFKKLLAFVKFSESTAKIIYDEKS